MSLAKSASPAEQSTRLVEPVKRGSSSVRTYPFLKAAFRVSLRANSNRDGLFIRSQLLRLPRAAKKEENLAGLAILGPVSELAFLADRRRDEAEAIHGRADHWDFERS